MIDHTTLLDRGRTADESGASAVEYGLLVTAIAAVIVIIVFALGGLVDDMFGHTCDEINSGDFSHSATTC